MFHFLLTPRPPLETSFGQRARLTRLAYRREKSVWPNLADSPNLEGAWH